jgi:hypothetical protein
MNANHIGSQIFHFLKVRGNGRPLVVPIVLEESPLGIVVVVEAPGDELPSRFFPNKSPAIIRNADPFAPNRYGGPKNKQH